jgi:glycosyltransferase involved in cell wall biosynthesis
VLFVTWDGPQVSYLESLFVPIFERLGGLGIHFDVLQFRWGEPALTIRADRRCRDAGIGYRAVIVPRGVPVIAPFVTALAGARDVRRAVDDFGSDLIMPRSLLPALAVIAAGGNRLRPMTYDADGLEADERVDFRGLSRANPVYRLLRMVERRAVRDAQSVLVRSADAAAILAGRAAVDPERFHVVANGRDPALFRPATPAERREARAQLGLPADAPVLVYSGSIGPQYRLDKVADTIAAVRRRSPDAQLLVLTSEPSRALDVLEGHLPGIGGFTEAVTVQPERVPFYLGAADAGLSFRSEAFSTRAIAPVKLGEYLLCGLPVIGTAAAGSAGLDPEVFFADRGDPSAAAEWLAARPAKIAKRAREVGLKYFSLDASVATYFDAIAGSFREIGADKVNRATVAVPL